MLFYTELILTSFLISLSSAILPLQDAEGTGRGCSLTAAVGQTITQCATEVSQPGLQTQRLVFNSDASLIKQWDMLLSFTTVFTPANSVLVLGC